MAKKYFLMAILIALTSSQCLAQVNIADVGLGQTIQIYTRFHTFVGKPSWLLIIRDIDNGQNIPYIYDVRRGKNFWLAFTYGRNYQIIASTLQFSPCRIYPYRYTKTHNFCNLESNGRIIRGKSLYITIEGNLTPNRNTYTCHVTSYSDVNFTIVKPINSE